MQYQKIFLTGFMGSGKSTTGKKLADKINVPFFDLDTHIEKKLKMNLPEIFSVHGESFFRTTEHQCLIEIIRSPAPFVLSLGGGTLEHFNNLKRIMDSGILVYLKTDVQALVNRLRPQKSTRPLLHNVSDENLPSFIHEMLSMREATYNQARHTVNANTDTEKTVMQIALLLSK